MMVRGTGGKYTGIHKGTLLDGPWVVFGFGLLWAWAVSWFIQLYLLGGPLVQWSAGQGLLAGHDSVVFHQIAVAQAVKIKALGWLAWELRPEGLGVAGILSGWYALTKPELWLWVPIQAFLFSLSAVLMRQLVGRISGDWTTASIAVLILILLPGAALLYVFPHRDVFVFFGFLLLLRGGLLIMDSQDASIWAAAWMVMAGLCMVLAGFLLAWTVRVFSAEIFTGLMVLITVLITAYGAARVVKRKRYYLQVMFSIVCCVAALFAMLTVHSGGSFKNELPAVTAEPASNEGRVWKYEEENTLEGRGVEFDGWQKSVVLPKKIDEGLKSLAGARERVIRIDGHGRSAVDLDVRFRSVSEIMVYVPRAFQLGFLSPFPMDWWPRTDAPSIRNLERIVMGIEMALVYCLLPFLAMAILRYWAKPALWLVVVPSVAWVMIYALTVPVVGTLVRYRYGPFLLLLCLALATLLQILFKDKIRERT